MKVKRSVVRSSILIGRNGGESLNSSHNKKKLVRLEIEAATKRRSVWKNEKEKKVAFKKKNCCNYKNFVNNVELYRRQNWRWDQGNFFFWNFQIFEFFSSFWIFFWCGIFGKFFKKIIKYGRIIRKFIFGEIFADRTAVMSSNPIPRGAMKHLKVRFFNILGCLN